VDKETPAATVKAPTFQAAEVAVAEQLEAPHLRQQTAELVELEKMSAHGSDSQPELLIVEAEEEETRNDSELETEALADQVAEALALLTAALGQ
jgi:hypothetical protein